MNIGAILKQAKKAAADNAPTILTAIGVAGTISTAVLASQASFKAADIIAKAQAAEDLQEKRHPLDSKEKFGLVWPQFVPAAGTGALTVAAILGANHISTTRAAALASAYSISQDAFATYKEKVLEKFGEKKEQAVRDELAKDHLEKNPPPVGLVMIGTDEVLVLDTFSGRYFKSTLEALKKAANDTNYQILHEDYASLTEFWDRIGLPQTAESDEIGWNTDTKLEVEFGTAMTEDGRPCITLGFRTIPYRGHSSY